MFNLENALIVFALEAESSDLFDAYRVLYTGVGKVQATLSLSLELTKSKPDLVINMGTAGSRNFKAADIVNPISFVQRDMDATALGFQAFQTPFASCPPVLSYGLRLPSLPQAICGTGDNFSVHEEFGDGLYDVVDMEAYALASTCKVYDVPFLCLKYISDGADGEADMDWNSALKDTAQKLKDVLIQNAML